MSSGGSETKEKMVDNGVIEGGAGRIGHLINLGLNHQGFPLGIILKKAPGNLRLILHLSLLKGESLAAYNG